MTDLSGISGGCQDLYTVYPSGNTSCRNVTVPDHTLGVKMTSSDTGGLLSRFGWPASCSDLQFDLLDGLGGGIVGKPPYQLSVAPAFRTPLNITFGVFQTMFHIPPLIADLILDSSVKWTVVLDHGHPFFVSVTDSDGVSWVNGPLHAGAGAQDCFGPAPPYPWLTLPVSLGMSFSFLILGLLLALIGVWFFASRRPVRFSSPQHKDDKGVDPYYTEATQTKSASSRGEARRESHARVVQSTSASPGTSGNGNFFNGLYLRRPSNNRAPSSEMVLMHDRPTLRRDHTSGTFDLAASPVEEHNPQLPFSREAEILPPRPSDAEQNTGGNNNTIIEPWAHPTRGNNGQVLDERGTIQASLGYPISPATHKRPPGTTSSSGGSPTSVIASSDGTRGSIPPSTHTRNSSINPQSTHIPPPRSNSTGNPNVSNHVLGHRPSNSNSYVPVVRSNSHTNSSSLPANTTINSGYPPNASSNGQHQHYQHQQQMHEVYVVHHDAGRAPPVTVFTRPGTVVTELPPGYDNLLPNQRHEYTPPASENDQIAASKPGPSSSASRPQNPAALTLDISITQDPPRAGPAGGMGLVHAEDMPLSAISNTDPTALPLRDPLPSDTRQDSRTDS